MCRCLMLDGRMYKMKNILEKSIGEILSDLRKEMEMGIWESEEEAISEYKLRRERRLRRYRPL